jgi:hypothetical protein
MTGNYKGSGTVSHQLLVSSGTNSFFITGPTRIISKAHSPESVTLPVEYLTDLPDIKVLLGFYFYREIQNIKIP